MNETKPDNSNSADNLTGVIATTGKGVGYVRVENREEDIQIPEGKLNTALPGDVVEVRILPERDRGREQGEVVRIVEQSSRRIVGTLQKSGEDFFLVPDNYRIYTDIAIPAAAANTQDGYKALIEIVEWNDPTQKPVGEIIEVIGPKGDHETEMRSIILSHNIDTDFPAEVKKEAHERKAEADNTTTEELLSSGRRDLRDLPTCTIDPIDAKDFDDALSFEQLPDGNYRIGVHIADVSHYVVPNSALDKEARERSFSVYLVDRTIPMLPEILSNDLCSLNPHEDKLAFSALLTLDTNGKVLGRWLGKSLIHSDRRYSYEDAQETINTGTGDLATELIALNGLAKKMRAARMKNGAIDFGDKEVRFVLDDTGKPIKVIKKERLDTHKLVEEFMLLANKEVALYVEDLNEETNQDHLFVYRVHDKPDHDKLEMLGVFLRAIGYDFEVGAEVKQSDLNTLLSQAEGKPEQGLISTSVLRSMAKAQYSTSPKGHFGLAFAHYSHFTSPIRRYPDLLVHRLLAHYLAGEQVSQKAWPAYEKAVEHANQREIQSVEAERESIKYKQVEFMRDKVGQTFGAVITGVSKYGAYVEEDETQASGMVNVRNMGDDFYSLDEKAYAMVGAKSGKRYQLGSEVKVKLLGADLDKKQLDFEFVNEK
jgi:ribonuclease R